MSTATATDQGDLFSHDEVYTFYADAFPIYVDSDLDKNKRNALLDAVSYAIGKEGDIVEEVLKIRKTMRGVKGLEQYFLYGKNIHPFGLPNANRISAYKEKTPSIDDLKNIINSRFFISKDLITIVSDQIITRDFFTKKQIAIFAFYAFLEYQIDFNNYSFEIDPIKAKSILGVSWGFSDIFLLESSVKLLGITEINYSASQGSMEYSLVFEISHPIQGISTLVKNYTFIISSIPGDFEAITFKVNDVNDYYGKSEFTFVYPFAEENRNYTYTELHPETPQKEIINDVYPMLPIKIYGKALNDEAFSVEYGGKTLTEHTEILAKKLGLDLNQLINGIKTGNTNYVGTHTAYLFLGANLNSSNNAELAYIFDYYLGKNVNRDSVSITKIENIDFLSAVMSQVINNGDQFTIEESGDSNVLLGKTYKRVFSVTGVQAYSFSGRMEDFPIIDQITDNMSFVKKIRDIPKKGNQDAFRISIESILIPVLTFTPIDPNAVGPVLPTIIPLFCYCLDRQVSETEWIRLVLIEPSTSVYGGKDYEKDVNIVASLYDDMLLENGNELRLPLQRSRLMEFSLEEQEDIILRAICIQIAYRDRDHIKWYKTDQFAMFMEFVLLVITVYTTIFSMGTMTWLDALLYAAIALAAPAVLKIIFEALEPILGKDLAGVITIVVAVVAAVYGYDLDATQTVTTALSMTAAVSNIHTNFTAEQIEELQKEASLFDTRVEDILEKVEKIQEGLIPGELSAYALGLLSKKDDIVYESPSEFFFRTIHVGNPGVRTLNYPTTYHRKALELPDLLEEDI